MGMTKAGYARHCGVSRPTIGKYAKKGLLVHDADGRIDRDASDEKLARHYGTGEPAQPADRSGIRRAFDELDLLSKAEAEQLKANYLALQRQFEHEQMAGKLVDIDAVIDGVQQANARVRNQLLSLPQRIAPQAAAETSVTAIQELVQEIVTDILTELSDPEAFRRGDG